MCLEHHPRSGRGFVGVCFAAFLFSQLLISSSHAATYYVDSAAGNDSNNGTASNSAWKSLTKVNGTTFQPGDAILFKAGGYWAGSLYPKGSGATNNPITIDLYGAGPKPIFDGAGLTGTGVVYLLNQQYWEINNLEITDDAATGGDRRGVYFAAQDFGLIHHLYLKNCYIHNIKGIVDQASNAAKRTGGYLIETVDDSSVATRFDDVLVENCVITTVDNIGIALNNNVSVGDYPGTSAWNARKFTHVVIRGNSINDVAKNAMIIRLTDETGLVEHNLCYDTAFRALTGNTIFARSARGTVFQFNEGYLNRTTDYDGCLYDSDLQSPACIFQYSYSHDNNHGLFWMDTDAADTNVIVRYNISQNDKGNIFCINYACKSAYIYNNTIFVGTNLSPVILNEGKDNDKTYYFYNNVILNFGKSATYQWFNLNGGSRTFDYNVFFGQHPASEPAGDLHKLTSDPMLIAPGTAETNNWPSLGGYKLKAGSPCIDSGMNVANIGGRDFWGNTVPYHNLTDRGANEWSGTEPIAFTQPATSVTGGSAVLNASVNPGGAATVYYFQFGISNYSNVTATNTLPAGTTYITGSNSINGLNPGTVYHYKVVATNSAGIGNGVDNTFTTVAISQVQLMSPEISNGFDFSFTNASGIAFKVYTTTNVALAASNWTLLGLMAESPAGQYQFNDPTATNGAQRYYQVRWP